MARIGIIGSAGRMGQALVEAIAAAGEVHAGGVDKGDDFGLLSVCGTDLPGAVYVEPAPLDPKSVARIVTQNNDALEPTVTPVALPEATSLSGVQPKLSLVQAPGGRYVARTKDAKGVHIIAKLPTVEYPRLPQVEELSMRLAEAAGVNVCEVALAPWWRRRIAGVFRFPGVVPNQHG